MELLLEITYNRLYIILLSDTLACLFQKEKEKMYLLLERYLKLIRNRVNDHV